MTGPYEIRFSRSAQRSLTSELPQKVAAAAYKFITSALADNPHRVGKQLNEPLHPLYSARRGEYRVIYRILEKQIVIEVVSIVHRRDAYARSGDA